MTTATIELAGVTLTHPDRLLYREQGITKRRLAEYYLAVAELMLPELAGRPLSLVRCPRGASGACFYQKHFDEATPPSLRSLSIQERGGERREYVMVDSASGLVALAQLGVLEIHTWGSRREHLEQPDRLIFDLDPGPDVPWRAVLDAARRLRRILEDDGLASFPKLTGGKGVHLVVPVVPELDWDGARAATRAIAQRLELESPERYTTSAARSERPGRIFIDYLRNGFGATAIALYSPRARPGAPVAVPVRWDELTPRRSPDRYTIDNIERRLRALARPPWSGYGELRQHVNRR
jgi:bifunctional non-homologous end joining protein LigD